MQVSMEFMSPPLRLSRSLFVLLAACGAVSLSAVGQSPLAQRITAPIVNANRVALAGSRMPIANAATDIGAVSPDLKLSGISLVFSRTPTQQAQLDALVAAQQNPASPMYHRFLTPDQFAARFGVADADIATVSNWLQLQGFSIDSVARSRNFIVFSGTAGLVASAFGAPLHYYKAGTSTRFAPSAELTLPAALASSVQAIGNLSNIRPRSHVKVSKARPNFTSSSTGNHFLSPADIVTIYNVGPAYSAGFTGVNQSIAILGQSAVTLADITAFQSAAGVSAKTPETVLVPSSGVSTIYADGDEAESDLDLEWSSTIAKGAQVFFVYTGDASNYGVFDSLRYAVDERISSIISISYGDCETDLGQSYYTMFNAFLQQGAAQGQTIFSASGDDGSTDCYGINDPSAPLTIAQQQALTIDFPGDSQYVTAVGGTEFPALDVAAGNNTYFSAQGSSDTISSALSYIPETTWNDDAANAPNTPAGGDPLGSSGGGVSVFTARPSWQAGTIGGVAIPAGSFRLVPDVSLDSSPENAPLLFCSSDETYWAQTQVASCNSGFRDASTSALTTAGGTSFAAPIFAAMVALINQSINSTGQGVINPTLYTLAANPTTYAAAFHDITTGGNQCAAGSTFCSTAGASEYAAATGYDEATGLGSVNLANLLTAWPQPAVASLPGTTTTLSPATASPAPSATDVITITVTENPVLDPAVTVPTGTVTLTIDGVAPTAATTLTLVNGVATYTFSSATTGAHVIVANYSGTTDLAPSTASLAVNVTTPLVGNFTMTATNITVASGASGTTTATITPTGGYTGTVNFSVTGPDTLTDVCVTGPSTASITSITPVTAMFTIYTSLSVCDTLGSGNLRPSTRLYRLSSKNLHAATSLPRSTNPSHSPLRRLPLPAALAATLLFFGLGRRRANRGMRTLLRAGLSLAILVTLSIAGLGLTACSSSATATTTLNDQAPGTYVLTLTATDSVNGTQTASTNFNLVVQ
jgi:subtilase family serine protease